MSIAADHIAVTKPVPLWYTRCGVPTGFGVAIQSGLFREEFGDGTATLTALQDVPDPVLHQSHFTHSQPNSFRHGSAFPAIWAQAHGADTKILGISLLRGAQTLLARADAGIGSPADLKGKRLLVLRRPSEAFDYHHANTLRLYEIALAQAGLTLADVHLVERIVDRPFIGDRITPKPIRDTDQRWPIGRDRQAKPGAWSDTVPVLLRGEADVITSGGGIGASSLLLEELLGLQVVFDVNWIADEVTRANNSSVLVFAVKADLLQDRPELVHRVLRRVLQAEADAARDPDELIRRVAREQQTSEHHVYKAHGDRLGDDLRIDFDPVKIFALETLVTYLHRIGVIDQPIDLNSWLAPLPLGLARASLDVHHAR